MITLLVGSSPRRAAGLQPWRQNILRTHSEGDITCVIPAPPGVIEVAHAHSRGGLTCISSRCEAATAVVAN